MHIDTLHDWAATPEEAVALQERLRDRVRLAPLEAVPNMVAGADVAYAGQGTRLVAAVAVVALPSLDVVDVSVVERDVAFPYVAGLFAFRELPSLIDALAGLSVAPAAVLFDAHGVAHPRRFGLASHAGLWLQLPTIGCAKCVLTGRFRMPADDRGATASITVGGDVVGAALRTRPGTMPVFVSPGHLVDVEWAVRTVLAATGRYRIPEPLRAAHHAAVRQRDRVASPNIRS